MPGLRFSTLAAVTVKSSVGPETVGEPLHPIVGMQPRELSFAVQYAAGGGTQCDDDAPAFAVAVTPAQLNASTR